MQSIGLIAFQFLTSTGFQIEKQRRKPYSLPRGKASASASSLLVERASHWPLQDPAVIRAQSVSNQISGYSPEPSKTAPMVANRILASSQRFQLSMY